MEMNTRDQALQIAATLMRPLIRLMIHWGVGINELVELAKRVYVEQAAEKLRLEGRKASDAALSAMTGVHRKDVKRIGADGPLAPTERRKRSLLSAVMSLWSGDKRFLDRRGAPRPLSRRLAAHADDGKPGFEDLIEEVSKGHQPRALLEAWIGQGAVTLDEQGRVCWAQPEYVAGESLQQQGRSARLAADRLEAAWQNLMRGPKAEAPAHFLFSVRAEGLLDEDVKALHAKVRRWGRSFGDRLNLAVSEAEARGRQAGGEQRYSFGIQSFAEPWPSEEQAPRSRKRNLRPGAEPPRPEPV
ncbi:hypothetical protein J7U46_22150 [Pelomonas sp. V22]|uniref:DUF6502 family protein n=1 Tax=Pelomonas sp. V22 TaxID=2822139 RepID=UPI0024A80A19|nr:DUF6502 family protein [Pelomonas sp. V22]MDI4635784.1 hypothetical protein [Pelomonas sp. V22]